VGERLRPTWWHDDHPTAAGRIADLAPADPRVARLAGGLAALGVGRGDAVAWQLPNGEQAVLLLWACWRLGAVAVPIHHRATGAEATRMLDALPADVLLGPSRLDPGGVARLVEEGTPVTSVAAAPDDLALVLHTSGSSGTPKAVLHTQATLAHKARTMVGVHGLGPDDVVLMPAPLGHVSGVLNGVTVPAEARMGAVLMSRWDPDEALDLIERHRVSFMVGPPTFFLGLADATGFTRERVASLRLVSAGGAGVTEAFCAATADRFGAVVKRSYGSTEAPTVATSRVGDDPSRGWTTDGRAVPGAGLRVDPTTDELHVRGPELFVGYADADRNADALTDDGWFRTGDTARVDDGWLTVTGRLGDVIIRGGENIAPAEVESVLEAHPGVRQAVVVGIPDQRLGERTCAVIRLEPGGWTDLPELTDWCARQGLARFKWPERLQVVESIPELASGKPDRTALRHRLSGG
jgi:cyclohexanecarboxylate-CoA ligase